MRVGIIGGRFAANSRFPGALAALVPRPQAARSNRRTPSLEHTAETVKLGYQHSLYVNRPLCMSFEL
jgi:hypothetical protein